MTIKDTAETGYQLAQAERELTDALEDAKGADPEERFRILWNAAFRTYRRLEDYRIPE